MSDLGARELAALVADRGRIATVQREHVPELLGELEAVRAQLWARLQDQATPVLPPAQPNGPDRWMGTKETAERMDVSLNWLYRRADTLPFAKRLSSGSLKFSERGLEKYMARR